MRSLAAVVPREHAESVRRALVEAGVLRPELEVLHDDATVAFAVTGPVAVPPSGARFEEREFPGRSPRKAGSYVELAEAPPEVRPTMPRSFDVVGDIVLVRIPPELGPYETTIGTALLAFVPGARIVGADRGVHGEARLRRLERLAGTGSWTTVHHENGLGLDVDVERAYFSPRLAREHALVAAEVRSGERVIDFAAGVGPFGAHILRDGRAAELVSLDANPAASALAERNLARASRGRPYSVVTDTIEAFAPHAGTCQRAILNLPHGGIKYLALVAPTLDRGGALHYYERTARSRVPARPEELVNEVRAAVAGSWSVPDSHVVHPYSPTEDIMAYRLERA
jgi:tRNA (guanine37-N1)-methyltransferase